MLDDRNAIRFNPMTFVNYSMKMSSNSGFVGLPTVLNMLAFRPLPHARTRHPFIAPHRALDLDLLLYGDQVGRFAGATLPHPDLVTRAWVLGPLAEFAPELLHPVLGEKFGALWQRFDQRAHALIPVALDGPGR